MTSLLKAIELKAASFPETFEKSKIVSIHQPLTVHSDLILLSLLIDTLKAGKSIAFFAFRENFAHYSSISKRLGVSLEQFISNGQLVYVESFFSPWNSDLPMTQVSPPTYSTPSNKTIHITTQKQLFDTIKKLDYNKLNTVYIDCVNFLKSKAEILYEIYDTSVEKKVQIVMGGVREGSVLSEIFGRKAEIRLILEQNVGGFGKLKIQVSDIEHRLLWKINQGKFEVSNSVTI